MLITLVFIEKNRIFDLEDVMLYLCAMVIPQQAAPTGPLLYMVCSDSLGVANVCRPNTPS